MNMKVNYHQENKGRCLNCDKSTGNMLVMKLERDNYELQNKTNSWGGC